MTTKTLTSCPNCELMDNVRKVSSIVSEGVSVGQYQSYVPLQMQNRTIYLPTQRGIAYSTVLAQKLAPPSPPSIKRPSSVGTRQFWKIIMFGGLGIFSFWIAVSAPSELRFFSWLGWFYVFITGGWFVLLIIGEITGQKWGTNITKREGSRAERKYDEVMQSYYKAIVNWDDVYYCSRCDGVFTKDSRFVPIEEMQCFLYE